MSLLLRATWIALGLTVFILPVAAVEWQPLGPAGGYFLSTYTDPGHPSNSVAITNDPAEVYCTADSGAHWTRTNTVPYNVLYDACCADASRLYGISYNRCYYSSNGGAGWNYGSFPAGLGYGNKVAVDPNDPGKVYVAGYKYNSSGGVTTYNLAFFFSGNGGQTWNGTTFSTFDYFYPYDVAVSKTNPQVIYVVGYKETGGTYLGALFRSNNAGQSWEDISSAVDATAGRYFYSVAVDPTDASRVYVGGTYVYRSSNGAGSFARSSQALNAYVLTVDPGQPRRVWAGGYQSVAYSDDWGEKWTVRSGPMKGSTTCFERITTQNLLVGTAYGLHRSYDGGGNWMVAHGDILGTIIPALAVAPSAPTTLFIEHEGVGVLGSVDSGDHWGDKGYFVDCAAVEDFLVHPADPRAVIAIKGPG